MLNKSKGNMYSFVTHTWNTIKGRCPHDCHYCYMKRWGKQKDIWFDEKELKTNLGTGNFIFVGSSCDMWADEISSGCIMKTLNYCIKSEENNRFLFQSKNPKRFNGWSFPKNTVLGTTIETNRVYQQMGSAPETFLRVFELNRLYMAHHKTMVTIEPVFDFDIFAMLDFIEKCHPEWVNIGADSGVHKLPEPPAGKVRELIAELSKFTVVIPKKNLNRILKGEG